MSVAEKHAVAVIMQRRLVTRGNWSVPSWSAVAVVAGENLAAGNDKCVPVRTDGNDQQFLWGGLTLSLFRDCAEAYRYNLVGETPSLFVICHQTLDGDLEPSGVTADHDEAAVGIEGDDQVFAVPIPPEIYQRIEQFVVAHYVPRVRRKRKRKNWSEAPER